MEFSTAPFAIKSSLGSPADVRRNVRRQILCRGLAAIKVIWNFLLQLLLLLSLFFGDGTLNYTPQIYYDYHLKKVNLNLAMGWGGTDPHKFHFPFNPTDDDDSRTFTDKEEVMRKKIANQEASHDQTRQNCFTPLNIFIFRSPQTIPSVNTANNVRTRVGE